MNHHALEITSENLSDSTSDAQDSEHSITDYQHLIKLTEPNAPRKNVLQSYFSIRSVLITLAEPRSNHEGNPVSPPAHVSELPQLYAKAYLGLLFLAFIRHSLTR